MEVDGLDFSWKTEGSGEKVKGKEEDGGEGEGAKEEKVEIREEDEVLLSLRSMWEFPAAWRLLDLFARAGLNIPMVAPADLERFLLNAEMHFGELEEIHARILGLGPASFSRWINKTKAVARANYHEFLFLFGKSQEATSVGVRQSSGGLFGEEVDDGLMLTNAQSYRKLDAEVRCRILHALLERQFSDLEGKLGEEVRSLDADTLRLMPFGYDGELSAYWYFGDCCRLYRDPDLEYRKRLLARKHKELERRRNSPQTSPLKRRRPKAIVLPFRQSRRSSLRRRTRTSYASEISDREDESEVMLEEKQEMEKPAQDEEYQDSDGSEMALDKEMEAMDIVPPQGESSAGWELVANGYDELIEFVDKLGKLRSAAEKAFINRIRNELAPEWEEFEKRQRKEREKREKSDWLLMNQKRSSRIHALQQKREDERKEEKSRERAERDIEEEKMRRRSDIVQTERERNRELRTLRRARSLAGVHPTAASSRPQRESSRRRSNYRDDGLPNEAQLDAQFSVRNERIQSESAVEDIDEYTYFYEDNAANRVLDRFRFLGPHGETTKLEYLDLNPHTSISAEGVLMPPEWTDALPRMIAITNVSDWCIDYGEDPSLWIRSKEGAWYRLERPANDYRWAFGSTRKKFEICSRLFILGNEMDKEDLTYEAVLDLLGQQYYNMRANKEADIKEVADFVLSQLESLTVPNLAESDFIEHLREYQSTKPTRSYSDRRKVAREDPQGSSVEDNIDSGLSKDGLTRKHHDAVNHSDSPIEHGPEHRPKPESETPSGAVAGENSKGDEKAGENSKVDEQANTTAGGAMDSRDSILKVEASETKSGTARAVEESVGSDGGEKVETTASQNGGEEHGNVVEKVKESAENHDGVEEDINGGGSKPKGCNGGAVNPRADVEDPKLVCGINAMKDRKAYPGGSDSASPETKRSGSENTPVLTMDDPARGTNDTLTSERASTLSNHVNHMKNIADNETNSKIPGYVQNQLGNGGQEPTKAGDHIETSERTSDT